MNYRKRQIVSPKLLTPIDAKMNVYRLQTEFLMQALGFNPAQLPVLDVEKLGTPQKCAIKLHKLWEVKEGILPNITKLIESKGIIVNSFSFGTDRVDSRTILSSTSQPIIYTNKSLLGDRLRFSLAYELGHLVMHLNTTPNFERDVDHEANLFAAEFLMPETTIRPDFENGITLSTLGELKMKWKVSMQSLLYRADDLGYLTYNQKRYLLTQFNQMKIRKREPEDAIIEVKPRKGEFCIQQDDIEKEIAKHKNKVALVLFSGVNYYTGQYFDLKAITEAAHQVGAYAGFDLAHAVGNKVLHLHDWKVDFACWCSYKYLNSGPGAVGGIFVQEKHAKDKNIFRLGGWWGHDEKTRFKMKKGFKPTKTAESWQMSNAQVMNMAAHRASLDIFDEVGMRKLAEKSLHLTSYCETLLKQITHLKFKIITPSNPIERGCQLSLLFQSKGKEIFENLQKNGIIADWREPNAIRIAPTPLYNSYEDIYNFYEILKGVV